MPVKLGHELVFYLILGLCLASAQKCQYSDVAEETRTNNIPEECPPNWISDRISTRSSSVTYAKLLLEENGESLKAAQEIAKELYKYRDTKDEQKEEIRWLRHTTDLIQMRNSANDKKKVFGFGCIGEQSAVLQDFEGKVSQVSTKEGIVSERTHKPDNRRSENLYNNVFEFENFLTNADNSKKIVAGYKLDWNKVFSMNFYQISEDDDFFTCDVADVLAYYIDGKWSVAASITNSSVYKEANDPDRIYFTEFLTFSEGNNATLPVLEPEPKKINLGVCTTEEPYASKPSSGTAAYETYEGKTQPTHFQTTLWEENPAIVKSLERGGLQKELVRDATSISNAAILIVPALLAFLPISLFHEVGLGTALFYAVATDIISVTPLLIKGIELIYFGNQKQWATQSYVYGLNDRSKDGVVELWTAKCSMNPRITRIGTAFLTVSLIIMILGIISEIVFSYVLHREKSDWEEVSKRASEDGEGDVFIKPNAGLIWYWNNKSYKKHKLVSPDGL